jgi:hypothetical protein
MNVIVRCNSTGHLYPLCLPQQPSSHALHVGATPSTLWHCWLGHLGFEALSTLVPSCNKSELDTLCHACQLSLAIKNFDLIHCDLWTSLILSISGYKYYLILLDDCSYYTWTFPLRLKLNTFQVMSHFFAHVRTQFGSTIKPSNVITVVSLTTLAPTLFFTHGVAMRMSYPHTSPQNGCAEHIIHSTNDIMRSLMFQASLPTAYWVEALHTATYLLNLRPTKTLSFGTLHFSLFSVHPDLSHLHVFGCKCYPNLSATTPHKLAPRSIVCIFLGYLSEHMGYQCLDLASNRLIILRHVTFDEASFPFVEIFAPPSSAFDFLSDMDCVPLPIGSSSFTSASPGVGVAAPAGLTPQAAASGTPGSPRHRVAAPVGLVPQVAASSATSPPPGFGVVASVGSLS